MSDPGTRPTPPRPVPQPGLDTAPFWAGTGAGELRLQRCDRCGHPRLPPAPICPRCWSGSATWIAASGRGRVRSTVTFHQVYHPAFADRVPYSIALVDLEEGPSLYAPVPAGLAAGTPVDLEFEALAPGLALPRFAPTGGDA